MPWPKVPVTLLAALAEATIVAVGYAAGSSHSFRGYGLVPLSCFAGMTLAVSSFFVHQPAATRLANRVSAAGLCLYVFLIEVTEVIAFAKNTASVLVAVACLCPLVVGGVLLPRRGDWLTASGYWLVLFGGATAMGYNVSHVYSGVGFFSRWLE
jgi:hypothetical protein